MPNPAPEPELLDVRQIAALIGCSTSTVWRWCAADSFPKPVRIGGVTRWRRREVLDFIGTREAA